MPSHEPCCAGLPCDVESPPPVAVAVVRGRRVVRLWPWPAAAACLSGRLPDDRRSVRSRLGGRAWRRYRPRSPGHRRRRRAPTRVRRAPRAAGATPEDGERRWRRRHRDPQLSNRPNTGPGPVAALRRQPGVPTRPQRPHSVASPPKPATSAVDHCHHAQALNSTVDGGNGRPRLCGSRQSARIGSSTSTWRSQASPVWVPGDYPRVPCRSKFGVPVGVADLVVCGAEVWRPVRRSSPPCDEWAPAERTTGRCELRAGTPTRQPCGPLPACKHRLRVRLNHGSPLAPSNTATLPRWPPRRCSGRTRIDGPRVTLGPG